MRADLLSGE